MATLNYMSYVDKRRHLFTVRMVLLIARLQSGRLSCVWPLGGGGKQKALQHQGGSHQGRLANMD